MGFFTYPLQIVIDLWPPTLLDIALLHLLIFLTLKQHSKMIELLLFLLHSWWFSLKDVALRHFGRATPSEITRPHRSAGIFAAELHFETQGLVLSESPLFHVEVDDPDIVEARIFVLVQSIHVTIIKLILKWRWGSLESWPFPQDRLDVFTVYRLFLQQQLGQIRHRLLVVGQNVTASLLGLLHELSYLLVHLLR